MNRTSPKVKLFYNYSHKDEKFKEELEKSLSNLKRDKIIDDWGDRKINAGDSIPEEIKKHIESFHIILLLFSPDFIASSWCYYEIKKAFELKKQKDITVIPIILKPCDWRNTHPYIKDTLALPTDAKAITKWENQDEAWLSITDGIRKVLQSEKFINKLLPESGKKNNKLFKEIISKQIQNLFLSAEIEKEMAVKKLLQDNLSRAMEILKKLVDKEQPNKRIVNEFLIQNQSDYVNPITKEIVETKLQLAILSFTKNPEEAKTLLEYVLKLAPNNFKALILYSSLLVSVKEFQKAIHYYNLAIEYIHENNNKEIESKDKKIKDLQQKIQHDCEKRANFFINFWWVVFTFIIILVTVGITYLLYNSEYYFNIGQLLNIENKEGQHWLINIFWTPIILGLYSIIVLWLPIKSKWFLNLYKYKKSLINKKKEKYLNEIKCKTLVE